MLPLLFCCTGIIILVIAMVLLNSTIDIQLLDTYYVIPKRLVAIGIFAVMQAFFILYYLFGSLITPLGSKLGYAHYLLTVMGALLVIAFPVREIAAEDFVALANKMRNEAIAVITGTGLFMVGQLLFFVNLILTLLARK